MPVDLESWPEAVRGAIRSQPDADIVVKAFPRGFPHDAPFVAVAGWLRDPAGRCLLVRHEEGTAWGDAWATPGGTVGPSERVEDALRREVLEECGIRVEAAYLRRVVAMEDERVHPARTSFTLIFESRHEESRPPAPRSDDRVAEARWFKTLPPNMVFREEYEDLL